MYTYFYSSITNNNCRKKSCFTFIIKILFNKSFVLKYLTYLKKIFLPFKIFVLVLYILFLMLWNPYKNTHDWMFKVKWLVFNKKWFVSFVCRHHLILPTQNSYKRSVKCIVCQIEYQMFVEYFIDLAQRLKIIYKIASKDLFNPSKGILRIRLGTYCGDLKLKSWVLMYLFEEK